MLILAACQAPDKPIRSIVLADGAYVRIANRQTGAFRDSTSLGVLSDDIFSIEVRAAGDSLPGGAADIRAMFMIGDDQGDTEIGIYRSALQSDRILVVMGNQFVQNAQGLTSLPIAGSDWDNAAAFSHVVLTYDGTTASVYGNGSLLAQQSLGINLDVGTSDALIGASWGTTNDVATLSNFWHGAIDEVRIWSEVLPVSEMQFRYENPDKLTRRYSDDGLATLIGLWRFNDSGSDGGTEEDWSGNSNDGTLNAGAGTIAFSTDGP